MLGINRNARVWYRVVIMKTFNSPRIYRFIEECSKPTCRSGVEAALAAGYSPHGASVTAARLLADSNIVEAVRERITQRALVADITPQQVLAHWVAIANADPSALVRSRRLNCRHCWGTNHGYRWKAHELAEAWDEATAHDEPMPDTTGGVGFRRTDDPNPDCPRCDGEGELDVYVADISMVPEKDRVLYAGLKQTKDGLEIKMHDQQAAWDNIRDWLGMIVKRGELTGANGKPLFPGGPLPPVAEVLPTDPKMLETMYREVTKGV